MEGLWAQMRRWGRKVAKAWSSSPGAPHQMVESLADAIMQLVVMRAVGLSHMK